MRLLSLFFLIVLLTVISCKKKSVNTSIKGSVSSLSETKPIEGANVKFYIKKLGANAYSSAFKLEEEQVVSSDGTFKFSFLKSSSDIEYKLYVSGSNYQTTELLINPSSIQGGEENRRNVTLLALGSLTFKLKSGTFSNPADEFLFNFKNELETGTSFLNQLYLGDQIDTVLNTPIIAEKYHRFNYILKRNGSYYTIDDSVFCTKGNNVQKEIRY